MAANIYLPQEGSEALPAYCKGLKLSVRNESESDAGSLRWTTTCQAQRTSTISGFHSQCHATFLHLTREFFLECTLFWEWNCLTFSRKWTTLTRGLSPAVCCDRQPLHDPNCGNQNLFSSPDWWIISVLQFQKGNFVSVSSQHCDFTNILDSKRKS